MIPTLSLRPREVPLEVRHRVESEHVYSVGIVRHFERPEGSQHRTRGLVHRTVPVGGGDQEPEGQHLRFATHEGRVVGQFLHDFVHDALRDIPHDLKGDHHDRAPVGHVGVVPQRAIASYHVANELHRTWTG